jgi:hypothetical protein
VAFGHSPQLRLSPPLSESLVALSADVTVAPTFNGRRVLQVPVSQAAPHLEGDSEVVPILCCLRSSRGMMMLSRSGLHRLRYHALLYMFGALLF